MTMEPSTLPTSIFERRKLDEIYTEICDLYLQQERPWVIGYSGGKDSTTTLQLVWKAIERLPEKQRKHPVYVIASDTKVETPVIVDYIDTTLKHINETAQATRMPFVAQKVVPTLNDTFWVNLIGRGYPAPTSRFRWCTERMKINPANRFIEETVSRHGEVIMVLGVRKSESATREQLMNTYQVKGHLLRRHASLRGAYVYAPIADFSSSDVWTYLLQVPSPWGSNNRDLAAMYRSASAGECPLVIDTSTASCGNSRFGCWVCTVASRDSSMEALVDSGEAWLEPLLGFREWLFTTTEPDKKHEFRDVKGRDGRVIIKKDGTLAARTYKLEISKQMLEKLLILQQKVRSTSPDPDLKLIEEDELLEIRRIWRTERQDWEDSVPEIYRRVFGVTQDIDWPTDDDNIFGADQKALLSSLCKEYEVPFELLAKLLEAERQTDGMARRSDIQKKLGSILSEEWREEEAIREDAEYRVAYQPKFF
jgi:DNA sulfur modification protein DndC